MEYWSDGEMDFNQPIIQSFQIFYQNKILCVKGKTWL